MRPKEIEAARRYHHQRENQRRARREETRQQWLRRLRKAVLSLAPSYPGVRRVALFGSLTQPGRFKPNSDIDVAVECDTVETESAFWRALERELKRDVDVRPLAGVIADRVKLEGEQIYGREEPALSK